ACGQPDKALDILDANRDALYRALACTLAGRHDEAYAIVTRDDMARNEDAMAIHALLLARDGKPAEAADKLRDALSRAHIGKAIFAQLEQEPSLSPVLETWHGWQARRDKSRGVFGALEPVPANAPEWTSVLLPTRIYVCERRDKKDGGSGLRAALRRGREVWAGDSSGEVFALEGNGRRSLGKPLTDWAIT